NDGDVIVVDKTAEPAPAATTANTGEAAKPAGAVAEKTAAVAEKTAASDKGTS
ncbi:hypothetical protein ABZM18_005160, partial [Escherichia coli]